MTGREFLTLARALAARATEAEWRSASSRAYYAAFHLARDLFRDLGFTVPRADSAHKYLAYRLQNCGHSALMQAGRDLEWLRSKRNLADYELHKTFQQQQASSDASLAELIIQVLTLATTEPTRTQVRDAVIAYERTAYGQTTWSPPPP